MTSRTFRHRYTVVVGALVAGLFGYTLGAMALTAMHPTVDPEPFVHPSVELIAEHRCWTGEAPEHMQGQIPGHVVVTRGGRTFIGGDRLVGQALAQIFEGADHDLTVHGFCP